MHTIAEGCPAKIGLAERIRLRELGAEAAFVRHFASGVRAFLDAQGVDSQWARDLFQDVFHDAIKRLRRPDLPSPSNLAGFLRRLALQVVASQRRRIRRRCKYLVDGIDLDATFESSDDPVSAVADAQVQAAVRLAVRALVHPREREVIRAHYLLDQAKTEICMRLGTSSGHFDVIVHRARQKLRAALLHVLLSDSV